jgi:hypothetical protein
MTKLSSILPAVAVVAVAGLTAIPAGAQGSYIGGTYCWTNLDAAANTGSNPTGAGYKLFIGHDSPRLLGFEIGYTDFGQFKKTANGTGGSTAYTFSATGWDLAATVRVPLGRVFGVYGKIGYLFWTSDLSAAIGDLVSGNDSGGSVFYAAGLRVNLTSGIALLAEWERDTLGNETTVDMVNAGLRINF